MAREVNVYDKTEETTKRYRDEIYLVGTEKLVQERTITTIKIRGEVVISSETKKREFTLHEVSRAGIFKLRMLEKPVFLLKKEGKYYYAIISKNLHMISCQALGEHLCKTCDRACAASDEKGGCQKVRDMEFGEYLTFGNGKKNAILASKRIEKYPFVTLGYETINVNQDCFMVADCSNFRHFPPRNQVTSAQKNVMKLKLAEWYYD